MMSRTFTQWFFVLVTLLLSGCGFHMRGAPDLPFKSIYLNLPDSSTLYAELSRNIRAGGTVIATDPKEADAVLNVLTDEREKKILTLNTFGRVREYALYQNFRFVVKDKNDGILVPPTDISLKREITYNEQQELSKQSEEVLIYREMQSDIVQRILRLLAVSKHAKATQKAE
jgi:LPS-assembly lipoprotein